MTRETKTRLIARTGSWLMRALFWTLRFRFIDHAGVLSNPPREPLLWAFWHNRLFITAYMFERYFPARRGAAMASQTGESTVLLDPLAARTFTLRLRDVIRTEV